MRGKEERKITVQIQAVHAMLKPQSETSKSLLSSLVPEEKQAPPKESQNLAELNHALEGTLPLHSLQREHLATGANIQTVVFHWGYSEKV